MEAACIKLRLKLPMHGLERSLHLPLVVHVCLVQLLLETLHPRLHRQTPALWLRQTHTADRCLARSTVGWGWLPTVASSRSFRGTMSAYARSAEAQPADGELIASAVCRKMAKRKAPSGIFRFVTTVRGGDA